MTSRLAITPGFLLPWVLFVMTGASALAAERPETHPTVAVAEITFTHPAARLVFTPDAVRDIITRQLLQTGQFKVIDWSRLSAVLFRRNLEWSDLVADSVGRKQIQDILLNDYFLTGGISSYGERWEYGASTFSKSKSQVARVQVELFLKDALTNEIAVAATGLSEKQRSVSQSLGFGAGGGSDPTLANDALVEAVGNAISELTSRLTLQNKNRQLDGASDHDK